jgi:hypothetical protein
MCYLANITETKGMFGWRVLNKKEERVELLFLH